MIESGGNAGTAPGSVHHRRHVVGERSLLPDAWAWFVTAPDRARRRH
nr:hypothetical protein [uncultured Duganella sp.]